MVKAPRDLKPAAMLRDSIHVWDERQMEWFPAWEHRFNRRREVTFFRLTNAMDNGPVFSNSFYCAPYRNALVNFDLRDTVGAPTSILFLVWFSWDNTVWYQYTTDFWGDLEWEDTAMPRHECMQVPILAPYICFSYGVADGGEQAYFPFELKVIFNTV